MNINIVLNITGSLCLLVAPVLFIMGALKKDGEPGKIDPNATTFFIRSIVSWLNLATYFVGSQATLIRCSVLIVSAVSLSALFFLSLFAGRWKLIKATEIICLVLTLMVGYAWYFQKATDPVTANILMQVILVISFVPAAWRSYRFEDRQTPATWLWAVVAYVFMTAALLVDPQGFKPFQLINPLIPGICGNGLLALLAFRQTRRAK